jgi:hypothetical protein
MSISFDDKPSRSAWNAALAIHSSIDRYEAERLTSSQESVIIRGSCEQLADHISGLTVVVQSSRADIVLAWVASTLNPGPGGAGARH